MTECERLVSEGIIPSDFFREEIRNEYKISSETKKVWAIQIDLLVKLIDVCKQNELRVWVCFGTLLGAIRHKGFIPWDDDIDVFMPREDYNKLLNLSRNTFSSPYFLQSPYSDPEYFRSFARLRNSNTSVVEDPAYPYPRPYNSGMYIDIFPLDGMSLPMWTLKKRDFYVRFQSIIGHAYSININPNPILRSISTVLHWPFIPYSPRRVFQHIGRIASKQSWNEASKVGLMVKIPYQLDKNIFDKVDFEDTIWLPFEHIKVPIPNGYKNILRVTYGDYMKFPPKEKRGCWHKFLFYPDIPDKLCRPKK